MSTQSIVWAIIAGTSPTAIPALIYAIFSLSGENNKNGVIEGLKLFFAFAITGVMCGLYTHLLNRLG